MEESSGQTCVRIQIRNSIQEQSFQYSFQFHNLHTYFPKLKKWVCRESLQVYKLNFTFEQRINEKTIRNVENFLFLPQKKEKGKNWTSI